MTPSCPGCGASRAGQTHAFRDPDGVFPDPFRYGECAACGLVFLVTPVDADRLYDDGYHGAPGAPTAVLFEAFQRGWSRRKAHRIIRRLHARSVLDFGCGRGDVLRALARAGASVWGVERQAESLRELREQSGFRAAADLSGLTPPPGGFDGITMWHVFEHVPAPGPLLTRLAGLAAPAGKLYIAVPNWDAWERRLFGDRWFHLDPPRHALQFSPDALSRTLGRNGWRVMRIYHDGWSYNLFGLFQTLLNLGPGPRNLLYRLVKRGTPLWKSDGFWWGLLWTIVAAVPAATLSLLLAGPLSWTGRASTFEILAERADAA